MTGTRLEKVLPELLRAERLKQDITQVQLSKIIGTSQANIARIESGTSPCNLSTIDKIAKALNVTFDVSISYTPWKRSY